MGVFLLGRKMSFSLQDHQRQPFAVICALPIVSKWGGGQQGWGALGSAQAVALKGQGPPLPEGTSHY